MYTKYLLFFVFIQTISSAPSKAPWKNWTFCKKPADPTKNNLCLVKAIKETEKDLTNGNSYFGTPSLSPLHIDQLDMTGAGKAGRTVAVDIHFKDMDIYGLSSWDLKEVLSDWDRGVFSAIIHLTEKVQVLSDYKATGKVLLLPISGQGKANITLSDTTVRFNIKGKVIDRKNKQYFSITDFKIVLEPKGMTFDFENLFNGNKVLGDNMNKFLNENWKEVLNDMVQPISDGLGEACKQISYRVFNKLPYDVLLPK